MTKLGNYAFGALFIAPLLVLGGILFMLIFSIGGFWFWSSIAGIATIVMISHVRSAIRTLRSAVGFMRTYHTFSVVTAILGLLITLACFLQAFALRASQPEQALTLIKIPVWYGVISSAFLLSLFIFLTYSSSRNRVE